MLDYCSDSHAAVGRTTFGFRPRWASWRCVSLAEGDSVLVAAAAATCLMRDKHLREHTWFEAVFTMVAGRSDSVRESIEARVVCYIPWRACSWRCIHRTLMCLTSCSTDWPKHARLGVGGGLLDLLFVLESWNLYFFFVYLLLSLLHKSFIYK